ncbi:MAG: NHL repeat-containing protein [Armatimonadota bacterium]
MYKRFTLISVIIAIAVLIGAAIAAPVSSTFKLGYGFYSYGYSNSEKFSKLSGVFFQKDRQELYITDRGKGQILVFDNKGMPIARYTHYAVQPGSSNAKGTIGEPRSIVVRKNGDILVVDNMCHYIDVLDINGRSVDKIDINDLLGKPDLKIRPICLALDSAENIYVSVVGDVNEIVVLSPSLQVKTEIDRNTDPERSLEIITGLWVDSEGKIYATYAAGPCVRIYAPDGKMLAAFGAHDSGFDNFSLPSGVVTDAHGNIWVVDALRHIVTVFSQKPIDLGVRTSVIHAMGGLGREAGQFAFPLSIAGDGANRIFVIESTGARVQAFDIIFPVNAHTGN